MREICRVKLGLIIMLAITFVGLSHANVGAVTNNPASSGNAVVYIRINIIDGPIVQLDRCQIIKQSLNNPKDSKVIYETGRFPGLKAKLQLAPVLGYPLGFGMCPSPNGRWLLVWETVEPKAEEGTAYLKTVWLMVNIVTGERHKIGEQPGDSTGYFPYWLDNNRILLERGKENAIYNVKTHKLNNPLPQRTTSYFSTQRDIDADEMHTPIDELSRLWRQQFIRDHYAHELSLLNNALGKIKELDLSSYLNQHNQTYITIPPDIPENFLIRPMGIVDWGGQGLNKSIWPSVAISPDGKMLARCAFIKTGREASEMIAGKTEKSYFFTSEIAVFSLSSGKRLWGKSVPQPYSQPYETAMYFQHPPRIQWIRAPWFKDVRWSRDGRYLYFATRDEMAKKYQQMEKVSVLDSNTWKIVLEIPGATDAFIIPAVK